MLLYKGSPREQRVFCREKELGLALVLSVGQVSSRR